ncbi:MAG: phosphoglycerate kinase, partial [Anaerolineales bacterium]
MFNKKTITDIDVSGKKVLVRVDFNVPMKDGEIGDDTRIRAALPTLDYLLKQNASLLLCSHLGRPKGEVKPEFSLRKVADHLSQILKKPVIFS